MTLKVTPFPWYAEGLGSEGYAVYSKGRKFQHEVCQVRHQEWSEIVANANFLAAAPDLYEAAVRVRHELKGAVPCDRCGMPVGDMFRDLDAAIRKAEGGEEG